MSPITHSSTTTSTKASNYPTFACSMRGAIINTNTIEGFNALDKAHLLSLAGQSVRNTTPFSSELHPSFTTTTNLSKGILH